MNKISFKCAVWIGAALLVASGMAAACGWKADGGSQDRTGFKASFEDSGNFRLFIKGSEIGKIASSLDSAGHYDRVLRLEVGGQTAEMSMTVIPGTGGDWTRMVINNPALGKVIVSRVGKTAVYRMAGESHRVSIPAEYVLFDDYGIIPESLVFLKYDLEKGGKQSFKRFRIPETFPGNELMVEIEFLHEESSRLNGETQTFRLFNWKAMGVNSTYWLDKDFRVILSDSSSEQAVCLREGFEDLMRLKNRGIQEKVPGKAAVVKKTEMIPMRDGIKLGTDLYFPDGDGPFAVILIRTPYKKEMSEIDGRYYARRGYVTAVQDVRGRFSSEGEWEPMVNEADDGYDTIEWLAAREWSTGKVGMIGGSYLGMVQLQAASRRPPHLVTIIPNVPPPDPFFNIPYEYGLFFTFGALWWAEAVETEATADLSMKKIYDINRRDYEKTLARLPVIDLDKDIFGRENAYWRRWIEHNVNDRYWERANYLEKLKNIEIPVFLQSGWFDGDGIGSKLAYLALKESKSPFVKLVLGPWGHTDQASNASTGRDMGKEAEINLQGMYDRWFDTWLRGEKNGILDEPRVQMYAIGSRRWLTGDTYPLRGTEFRKLFISSRKGAVTLKGDGKLTWMEPEGGLEFDAYTYDPGDPTPAWQFRAKDGGKESYVKITNKRKDILVFESDSFTAPVNVVGPMSFKLYASSSARDTDWFVNVIAISDEDVPIPLGNPWGRGGIRARFRNSSMMPELLEPDKVYEYTIDLWHTGITLGTGWRLRVEITSAYFPYFSRNLNTGGHNEMETHYVKARQRIYHSPEFPSHMILPVVELTDRDKD